MKRLSIAVCIPCTETHIKFLPDCIDSISKQTHQPNEVVICISAVTNKKSRAKVEKIKAKYQQLNIITEFTEEVRYAGQNRNRTVELSSSDIISFIDADDIMRYDRLYIIYMIFSMDRGVIGVIHKFHENTTPDLKETPHNFDTAHVHKYKYTPDVLHYGHCSFLRDLFNEYAYSDKQRGQDMEFVHNILHKYLDNLRIYDEPLTYYISNRSTFYNN